MSCLSFQGLLKRNLRQPDIASAMDQLITVRLIVVHALADLWHAIHALVEDLYLIVTHVVVNHHLAAADQRHFANLSGVEPANVDMASNTTCPFQGGEHYVFDSGLD